MRVTDEYSPVSLPMWSMGLKDSPTITTKGERRGKRYILPI
jgi:hypothetical protein